MTSGTHTSQWLPEAASTAGDAVFGTFGAQHLTYGTFATWVEDSGQQLLDLGVRPGDRVLVVLANCFEAIVYQFACWHVGAVAVPIVPIYRHRELRHIAAEVSPRAVVGQLTVGDRTLTHELDQVLSDVGAKEVARIVVGGEYSGWTRSLATPQVNRPPAPLATPPDVNEVCLILYTSGTTAAPKGAELSSKNIELATQGWITRMQVDSTDIGLAVAPLSHIAGLVPGALVPLFILGRTAILPRWDAAAAVDLIQASSAAFSCGAPVFLQEILEEYARRPDLGRMLRFFVCGGANISPTLIRQADALGIRALRAYGMSETAGVITGTSPNAPLAMRAELDGELLPGIEVRTVAGDGSVLPPGSEGSLQIRGDQVFGGYTDKSVTATQLVDGWFEPGDVGVVRTDGWLRITGRTKDIVNRGGEKFSCRDIEEAIAPHPAVSRVAVASVPDQRLGETVAAYVVLQPEASWPGNHVLRDYLLSIGLAKAKVPQYWTILETLPVSPTGKVQKHLLPQPSLTTGVTNA